MTPRFVWSLRPWLLASRVLVAGACAACVPPLERTPHAPARNDAAGARADAPVWSAGDIWRYRGTTFDSKDNRFYLRVVRAMDDAGRPAYEVEEPRYVDVFDARTLRIVRHRDKETGRTTGAVTHSPLWFPLDASARFSMSTTYLPDGEEKERPLVLTCRVVSYEDVEVHAGTFAAFRIDCETNDGFAEHWYAPAVKNMVKMRWMGKRESFVAELWDYTLAK